MLVGASALLIFGGVMAQDMMELMRLNFSLPREVILDQRSMATYLMHSGKIALWSIQPFMIAMVLAAIIGPISLGGWLFAAGSMAPNSVA